MPTPPSPPPTRAAFPHLLPIATRWMDNDVYGHVNNVVYYAFFDTVINRYLIAEGGLDIARGGVIEAVEERALLGEDELRALAGGPQLDRRHGH